MPQNRTKSLLRSLLAIGAAGALADRLLGPGPASSRAAQPRCGGGQVLRTKDLGVLEVRSRTEPAGGDPGHRSSGIRFESRTWGGHPECIPRDALRPFGRMLRVAYRSVATLSRTRGTQLGRTIRSTSTRST